MSDVCRDARARVVQSAGKALREMEELLKSVYEYKYARMHELLSAGPDASATEEWEDVTLKEIAAPGSGMVEGPPENMLSADSVDNGIPVVDGESVSRLRFDPLRCRQVPREFAELEAYGVGGSDIVLARRGPHSGACAIMPIFFAGGVLAPECVKLVPDRKRCEPFYFNNVLHHYYHTGVMDTVRISAEEKEISLTLLGKLPVRLPSLQRQKLIADELLSVSAEIVACEQMMEKLKELGRM